MSIYDDLRVATPVKQDKDTFGKKVARFFLPKQLEKDFGVEKPKPTEEIPVVKPKSKTTIYDNLLTEISEISPVAEVPEEPAFQFKLTKPSDHLRERFDEALLEKYPGTIMKLAEWQEDPFGVSTLKKKGVMGVAEDIYSSTVNFLKDSFAGVLKSADELAEARADRDIAGTGAKSLEMITRMFGLAFAPLVAPFVAGEKIPGLAPAYKAISTPLTLVSEALANLGRTGVDIAPLSPEVKEKLREPVAEATGLIGIFAFLEALKPLRLKPGEIQKFVVRTQTQFNLPKEVYISPAKVRSLQLDGVLTTAEEAQMVKELGMSGAQWKAAFKDGVTIKIPLEKVVTQVNRPWWEKIRTTVGFKPSEPVKTTSREEKPTVGPRGLLAEGYPEAQVLPTVLIEPPKPISIAEAPKPVGVPKVAVPPTPTEAPKAIPETPKKEIEVTGIGKVPIVGAIDSATGKITYEKPPEKKIAEIPSEEKFYIRNVQTNVFEEVPGKKVEIVEGVDTFVHKEGNRFLVSEAKSGLRLGSSQPTRKAAIEDAKRILEEKKEQLEPAIKSAIEKQGISPRYAERPKPEKQIVKTPEKISVPKEKPKVVRERIRTIKTDEGGNFILEGFDTKGNVISKSTFSTRAEAEENLTLRGGEAASVGGFREGEEVKLGGIENIRPMELPELVEFAKEVGAELRIQKRFRKAGVLGRTKVKEGIGGLIDLLADLARKGNEAQFAKTLGHELGHWTDFIPEKTLKRGNLLGRLLSLRSFLNGTFTKPDGTEIKNPEIRKELQGFSDYWRPWDKDTASPSFKQYRQSSKELYADSVSGLFNNPGLLEQMAPTFYREFFDALDAKPEAKRAYFDMQELLSGTREELIAHRRSGVQQMFKEADQKAVDIQTQRQRERELKKKSLWFKLRTEHVDKNTIILDKVDALEKQGVVIPDDWNPRYLLRERNRGWAEIKAYAEENLEPVTQALEKAGIDWLEFGEALTYERIISGDRSELANPKGLSPASAEELFNDLKTRLGPERAKILEEQLEAIRRPLKETMREAYEEGFYSIELFQTIAENAKYAPYRVIEYLENKVTPRIYKQIGTLKDIANPAEAIIMKTLITRRAIQIEHVKKSILKLYDESFPDEIEQAPEKWTGMRREYVESKDQNKKTIPYWEKGRLRAKYVDAYVADSINNSSYELNSAAFRGLKMLNRGYYKPLFIGFNIAFQSRNLWRDFKRAIKAEPSRSVISTALRIAKSYAKALPAAKVRAFGMPEEPTPKELESQRVVRAGEKTGILSLTYNDLIFGEQIEDVQLQKVMSSMSNDGLITKKQNPYFLPVWKVLDAIRHFGDLIETIPKIAAMYRVAGKGSIGEIIERMENIKGEQWEKIVTQMGSPDFLTGGTMTPVSNELFLFSNAIVQATRTDVLLASQPKTRGAYWWKTMKMNIIPKIVMYGALLGAFGPTVKKIMESAAEYDKTQYIIIPLGEDENGKPIYFRMPQDDMGRIIGGLFWKSLRFARGEDVSKDLAQVFDYAAGQFPTATPSLELFGDVMAMVSGRNPYDLFRGRNVLTEDEFKAGGWVAWKKFLGYEFQQQGGNVLWKFYAGEQRPREKSTEQKILELPIISNVIGSFIKIGDYGQVEILREELEATQSEEAKRRLRERDAINDKIKEYQKLPASSQNPAKVQEMARDIADMLYESATPRERSERLGIIRSKLKLGIVRGESDPVIEALFQATSNDQKVAVLLRSKESMEDDVFKKFLIELQREQVISGEVRSEVLRSSKK